jgi:uncharacterized protein (TIGR00369 family)
MEEKLTYANLLAHRQTTLDGLLGIEIDRIDEDGVVLSMPITQKVHQPAGVVHGGIYLVLAESAAGIHACYLGDLSQVIPVGIENSASHLRSASEGHLRAEATLARRSRSFTVHTVEIRHVESGDLLSVARVTNYYKDL